MKRRFAIVLLLGVASIAFAQTNAPVRDFGAGFRKFYQLGLPDATGGAYGKLEFQCIGSRYDSYSMGMDGSELEQLGVSGNAWRVKDLGGGTNRYVVGWAAVVDAMDWKAYEKWQKHVQQERSKASATQETESARWEEPDFAVSKWKAADLGKDTARILARLENPDENTRNLFEYDSGFGGQLLLVAAHLSRSGMTNEANRLAARLFALQPDARKLLQQAVTLIASAQYRQSYVEFRGTRDWTTWHKSLVELLGRFTTGWVHAPGVRKLAELAKARVDNAEPPALEGEGLSDEDRALARRLAVDSPARGSPYGLPGHVCWIFPQPLFGGRWKDAATNEVLFLIQARGMKSVPMLIALLRDNTLTQPDATVEIHSWSSGGDEDLSAEAIFREMENRPRTRGEIARAMLQPLLLLDERQRNEVNRMGVDDFATECEAWYKENKDKTMPALARAYLARGDQTQRQYALEYLMRPRDLEANHGDIERILLEVAQESRDTPYILHQYVQQRRDKASNFVEQVAVVLLGTNAPSWFAGLGGGRLPTRMELSRMAENRHGQFVKQLRELVAVKSVKVLVAEYLSCTQSVVKAYQTLHERVMQENPLTSLDTLLEAVKKTDDPKRRVALLELLPMLRNARSVDEAPSPSEEVGPEDAPSKPVEFDPEKHDALWRKLLDDPRGEAKPVREAAAWAIVELFPRHSKEEDKPPDDEDNSMPRRQGYSDIVAFFGDRGVAMLLERAKATLDDKPVADVPGAWKVNEEQRGKMLSAITSATDVATAVAGLTPSQQLALEEIGMTNRILNAKLRPLADRIVEVKVRGELKSAAGLEAKLRGRSLDRETVRILVEAARQVAREGIAFELAMNRLPNVGGMRVILSVLTVSRNGAGGAAVEGTNLHAIASVIGTVWGGNRSASCWWSVREGDGARGPRPVVKEAGKDEADARMMDEMEAEIRAIAERHQKIAQDGFWNALDVIMEKGGAYAPVEILIQGRVPSVVYDVDEDGQVQAANGPFCL